MPKRKNKKPSSLTNNQSSESDHEKDKALFEELSSATMEQKKTFSFDDILSQPSISNHSRFSHSSLCDPANCTCDAESMRSHRSSHQ